MATKMGPKATASLEPLDLSMLPEKRDYRRIAAFAETYVKVPKGTGAGQPFKLRRWQKNDIAKRFYPPTGKRPRQGLVSLSRGNGKSGIAAVFALYGLFADGIESAQVLLVASDERQARIVFNACKRMIELEPELSSRCTVYGDRIHVPATDSVLMPLPAEPAALQGWDPTLVVVDELHVVTEPVWEAMALASGKRPESLILAISTPADRLDSIMWKLVEYGREHPEDKSFALVEYTAPDGCALDDWDAVKAANPALDDFLHRDAIESTRRTTREESFRRYRLGQWVGSADSWLPWGAWAECEHPDGLTLPEDGEKVVLAFDGSASGDSTALIGSTLDGHVFKVAMWEAPPDDERWRVPRHEVAAMMEAAFDRWDVLELAADPWGWRTELEEWAAASWSGGRVVEWNTAHAGRMAPATDRLYAAVMDHQVTHDGDARLDEHLQACRAKRTPMGDLVTKDKRGSKRKIDGAVGAIVAYDRAAWHLANPPKRRRVVSHRR